MQLHPEPTVPRARPARLGLLGIGLGLLAAAGCGVGTDPSLLDSADAGGRDAALADAAPPTADAATDLVGTTPPIDELTYDQVEVATFALG